MIGTKSEFVGLKNYIDLLTGKDFWIAANNSLIYAIIAIIIDLFLPYVAAYAVTKVGPAWQGLYKTLIFLPSVIPLAVYSVIFLWLYNPVIGLVVIFLHHIGLRATPGFLTDYNLVI